MRLSLIALVAANLVPLAGVLWLGWSVFAVFALYWSESAVVGAFTILQLLLRRQHGRWRPRDAVGSVFLAAFFCVHYGMFLFVHAMLLCHLFGEGTPFDGGSPAPLRLLEVAAASEGGFGLWALIGSHGVSFVTNFLPRERDLPAGQLMVRPYPRLVAMHVTLLAGGALLFVTGPSTVLLALLVAAKIAVDAAAHRQEHRRATVAAAVATA